MEDTREHFAKFRKHIIGQDKEFDFLWGRRKMLYADWIASGRLYRPIEQYVAETLGPYVGNTHTETTLTGTTMTAAYHQAQDILKQHVNCSGNDVALFAGFGMTAVVNKFQRILGLRVPEQHKDRIKLKGNERPLIIVTHMEHHSNHTTWMEGICDVEIIQRSDQGLPNLNHLEHLLKKHRHRKLKIGSFSACSNVTGITTPYYDMAEIVHRFGGFCFVDFSASAPYSAINMHPGSPARKLDAIFFSPHKFLGGPGSSGVIAFDRQLYRNQIPDHPGGGTVKWTNPWGQHSYFEDIEVREDGGTPGFLQAIRAALAILLKQEMGIEKMKTREQQLKDRFFKHLDKIPSIAILEPEQRNRIGIFSFYVPNKHHNLIVRLLNDKFGIQTRGGCSCAGTYGHLLLNVDREQSQRITSMIETGDFSQKPGWVRISLHPTMTDDDIDYIAAAIEQILNHYDRWGEDYVFDSSTAEFRPLKTRDTFIDLEKTFHCCSQPGYAASELNRDGGQAQPE